MNIHEIIGYFEKAYKSGENEYQCLCPAHNDKHASLGVKQLSDVRHCYDSQNSFELMLH